MDATKKAPEIDQLLQVLTGKDRTACINQKDCMLCDSPDLNFRDEVSKREYSISGMCQNCQDEFFGVDEAVFDEAE